MNSDERLTPPGGSSCRDNGLVPLSTLRPGERGVIEDMACGRGLLSRMTCLGFTPGASVTMLQNYGRGPLIALVRDARVALGRGEAARILVHREPQ